MTMTADKLISVSWPIIVVTAGLIFSYATTSAQQMETQEDLEDVQQVVAENDDSIDDLTLRTALIEKDLADIDESLRNVNENTELMLEYLRTDSKK